MPKILKLNNLSSLANKVFPSTYALSDNCDNPDGIVVRSFKMHDYKLPESVICVARAGAGVNNIPTTDYADKGVVVFNTPGANANAVKELAICSMLLCGRKITDGVTWTQSLKGETDAKALDATIEASKKGYVGGEVLGKTLGIIGMGAIGMLVANAAVALGMNIIGFDRFLSAEKRATLDKRIQITDNMDELLANSDFITLHIPLTPETKGTINKDTLAKCKDKVNIINTARGDLCDNNAIIEGIKSGKINRYVTDFPAPELLGIPNIITTPHLGASTPEAEDNCIVMAAQQMIDFMENGNIVNSVNFPAVTLKEHCKKRVTVAFKGNLNIKAEAEKLGAKVCCYAEGKRGEYGYAILGVENCDGNGDKLEKISGVLKVRRLG